MSPLSHGNDNIISFGQQLVVTKTARCSPLWCEILKVVALY